MEIFLSRLVLLPAVLSAFVINGFFSAYTATKLGDPTSRIKGKLTLSPRVHTDMVGTLLFLLTGFGWTPALDVNPRYFKKQKRDSIITVLSGSFANFIFAFFAYIIAKILAIISLGGFWEPLHFIVDSIVELNIWLGLFCLIPIPPLNGFLILEKLLPTRYFRALDFLQQYGFILVVFLSITHVIHNFLNPLYLIILNTIHYTVYYLFGLFGL